MMNIGYFNINNLLKMSSLIMIWRYHGLLDSCSNISSVINSVATYVVKSLFPTAYPIQLVTQTVVEQLLILWFLTLYHREDEKSMRGKRLLQSICLLMIRSGRKRARFLRKHNVFKHMGEYCTIQRRKIPLYPKLISIGDNVHLAAGVSFVTHDITHIMLKRMGRKCNEKVGCIEIGDNVFVGTGTRILYDVKIGSNVIIGAGSIVTKDIPDNSVAAGSPARVIR